MGPGQNFLTRVGSDQPSLVYVLVWKISPKNPNFSIFAIRVKKNLIGSGQKVPGSKPDRPHIYCGSKVCSGRVGSGPISTLNTNWFIPYNTDVNLGLRISGLGQEGHSGLFTTTGESLRWSGLLQGLKVKAQLSSFETKRRRRV